MSQTITMISPSDRPVRNINESHWLHKEGYGWMSDQASLIRYSHLHFDKFGTEFAPVEG